MKEICNTNLIEKYIFVVTYGRSGSTILMKILNSIENSDIKGENFNLLFPLFESYQQAIRATGYAFVGSHLPDHPWYGVGDINPLSYAKGLSKVFTQEILKVKTNTRVAGFKEIRYVEIKDDAQRSRYINFLRMAFDNVYIIFNRRNLDDVSKSGWWKDMPYKKVINIIKPIDDWMIEYHKKYPEYTYIVNYDDYKNSPEHYRRLFEFIGEEINEEKVAEILKKQLTHMKTHMKTEA